MTDIATWKFAIDAGMIISLLFLCYRFARATKPSVNAGQILSLESSLRTLVREAETSSLRLTEELSRRQKSMEEVLYDLETVEHRVNKAIDQAQLASRKISTSQPPQAQTPNQQKNNGRRRQGEQTQRPEPINESPVYEQTYDYTVSAEVPEPPSFESPSMRSSRPMPDSRMNSYEAAARTSAHSSAPRGEVNIYGEPISPVASEPRLRTAAPKPSGRTLHNQIEKQQIQPRQIEVPPEVERGLEEIYAQAEQLLKAGQSLEAVVARTRLPYSEIQMLSQVVSQEVAAQREADATHEDQRLGVLSPSIRRSNQVV